MPAAASTGVAELLRGPVRPASVLLSVPAAVYLSVPTPQGVEVVGVLTADAARLPLGLVLSRARQRPAAGLLPVRRPGDRGRRSGGRRRPHRLGRGVVGPAPRLPGAQPALLPEGVRTLRTTLYGEAPHSAFTLPGLPGGPSGPLAALRGAVRRADLDAALRTATRLVGLGPGLTPAGDDVLAGTVAGLVLLGHPAAERFGAGVHALATGRTTELSRALLKHAAAGQVSGEFAAVVRALIGQGDLEAAIATLLATGSTSGRALALGLCTAIDLAERTTRTR